MSDDHLKDRKMKMRKRCVFTDGLKTNKFTFQEYEDGVYAIIGPFDNFTSDGELQDYLIEACRKFNLRHGHLSQKRYDELQGGIKKGRPGFSANEIIARKCK